MLVLGDPDEGWWQCRGILAPNYLRQHLALSEHIPSSQEIIPLYEAVRRRWVENYAGLRRQGEPYTRSKFLDPTLRDLGWRFVPESLLPQGNTRKRPDYCLFADEETEQRVAAGDATDIFRASYSVLEAKRAEHSLDKVSTKETPGWFPSQQIQDYLRWATDGTGLRFFRWGILTNGSEWRLYCFEAPPDAYFAFHLARGAHFCPLEEFRLFLALFRPEAFARNERGRTLLDAFRDESLTHQLELETNLRRRVFDVLEELAEGFYKNPANGLSESDLSSIYENSLIFLYRLLFVLYAESRGLLPVKSYGPRCNKRYREEYSLTRFVDKLRDPSTFPDDAFDEFYKEILKLFHLVDGSRRDQNERLGVTRYNGRLFSPGDYRELEQWWIGERTLGNVIRQLAFAQPPSRAATAQQKISTGDTVDYSTLEVRQLVLLRYIIDLSYGRC